MEKIIIGKIVNVVGLKGEVKVYCYTDRKERFEELPRVYVGEDSRRIKNVRFQGNVAVLKLEGIEDRNDAERQKGKMVSILESDLKELPKGTYYVRDLQGVQVFEAESLLGTLTDVVQSSAQDLYEIQLESGRKILLPAVKEFILSVDMDNRTMHVKLPEGLLDL